MSASLDHVTPLSRGGSHNHGNLAIAHLICNVIKSNSVPAGLFA
jgi:5-methylcytosine-specific restriction endonuclease McrA